MTELRNDFPAGVLTGDAVAQLFAYAKAQQFAVPAANCIGSNSMNAVMETAGRLNSPVIIQFSTADRRSSLARRCRSTATAPRCSGRLPERGTFARLAEAYGARVVLHTDHCPKPKLGWIDGLLDVGEEHFAQTGEPLFSSHMLDLSEEPIEENLDICVEYLETHVGDGT